MDSVRLENGMVGERKRRWVSVAISEIMIRPEVQILAIIEKHMVIEPFLVIALERRLYQMEDDSTSIGSE